MRLLTKLLASLCFLPITALSQERMVNSRVGPYGDQTRLVIALTDPTPAGYKLQSMIIDVSPAKNKQDEPSAVQLDLTSTLRSLSTGAKQQKILILRWQSAGGLETRCDGKWTKQKTGPALEKIIALTKAVIETVPLDAKAPTEFKLSLELEQQIYLMFDSLGTEKLPCLRDLH